MWHAQFLVPVWCTVFPELDWIAQWTSKTRTCKTGISKIQIFLVIQTLLQTNVAEFRSIEYSNSGVYVVSQKYNS